MDQPESECPATATGPQSLKSEEMRRKLQLYFMNPLEKWTATGKFPWKLAIQVVKVVFVTFQLCVFATYRAADVNYSWDNKITFSHLFLKDWDSSLEVLSFPPSTGPLAVYKAETFYEFVDFAIKAYVNVQEAAIGPYSYKSVDGTLSPIQVCQEKYLTGIFGFNETLKFKSRTETKCIDVPAAMLNSSFSSKSYFRNENFTILFSTLLEVHLLFTLKTVRFRDLGPFKSPDCFRFDIDIKFNNQGHDGQLLVTLEAPPTRLPCKARKEYKADTLLEKFGRSGINYIVIMLCMISFVLCCRAIYRAQLIKREAISFFKAVYNREMTTNEKLEFLNFWYLLIIMNDTLIVFGSVIKERIENKQLTGDAWNFCSLLLGIGNVLVWMGILRYLGFFRSYNILILTLKRAAPDVLRFIVCAFMIYAGFTFSGWLILGPYNVKFSTLSTTSECLFAIINGDDLFETFGLTTSKSLLLWWFCRVYLYTFTALFTYVVISLFVALILDAYEVIKMCHTVGFPKSMLDEFVNGVDVTDNQPSSLDPEPCLQKVFTGSIINVSDISHDHNESAN